MSNLIAIAYPDVATATRVRDRLLELQRERLIILADAPFGGEIIQTSLSEEAEADLREAVRHVQAVAEQ
ncbi:hypothetical protein [Nonomuraea dietziae]|uniref:hypothetical protein n=1 Tax=Nonomuraea dietziae TaxID=65515 RepID=UPI0033ED5F8B